MLRIVPEGVLGAVANKTNQAILSLLAVEPAYPRRIAGLLSLSEAEVARRLRAMEHLGLVVGHWSHIGKNVKLYKLATPGLGVRFTAQGIAVQLGAAGSAPGALVNPLAVVIPEAVDFVGRDAELAVLEGPDPVVFVEGIAGIGKTSLLARFARSQAASKAVFWHTFRGVESLNWLASRVAGFLAQHGDASLLNAVEAGAELADKREAMLRAMDAPGIVFVFDDVHQVGDEAVRSFLADAAGRLARGKLVLAAREQPKRLPPQVATLVLGGLKDEDVRRMLERKGLAPPSSDSIARLRTSVGGHPLALVLLLDAAERQGVGIEELAGKLPRGDVEEFLLREVDATLTEDERDVLAHASVFRGRFTVEALAALSRKDPEPTLLKLRRRLLVTATEGEYALHEVLRTFFHAKVKGKADLHDRAADHFLAQSSHEGRLEAMHHLLAAGRKDRVLGLLSQDLDLEEFDVIDTGYHDLYLGVLELFQRPEVPDDRRWALILDERGDIRYHRAQLPEALAHYDEAEALFRKLGDAARLADLAWKRGLALQRLGKPKDALAACEAGLKVAPPQGLVRERLAKLQAQLRGK